MWSRPNLRVLARQHVVLASVTGAVLLTAGTGAAFAAADALGAPAPVAHVMESAPIGQPVARVVAAPPAVPGVLPTVTANASCTVLAVAPDTGVRTVSVTVTYTVAGGTYRLGAADGPLRDGDSWTSFSTAERTSPAGPLSVPNVLASSAFTPSGTYLGVVSGPDTTASC
jgi:hypothetical protein